jgi:hypothetical protein
MIKGYINSLVSKYFFVSALGEHVLEDETLNLYDVLRDKLEELTLAGNLPIFKGFYTEYVDDAENEINNRLDDHYVVRNYVRRNEMKTA